VQLDLAWALRDEGMARVTEASDAQDIAVVDQAIETFVQSGRPFSANDVRPLLPPLRSNNLVGARFSAFRTRKQIVRVGYTPSTDPGTHGHPVAVWQAAWAVEAAS
jgi:hypothetical protein